MSKKFVKNLIITAKMELVTGLHIGGIKETVEIGGIDNPVIIGWKNNKPIPMVPGSSLKGKIRSLLDLKYAEEIKNEPSQGFVQIGSSYIKYKNTGKSALIPEVFGVGAKESENVFNRTRLIIRDAYPTDETIKWWEKNEDILRGTEVKAENTVNRITSAANPRFFERVPAGSVFGVEIVVSLYEGDKENEILELVFEGLRLLQDNYLGGSGSRGYGKVRFKEVTAIAKTAEDYENGKEGKEYDLTQSENYKKLLEG